MTKITARQQLDTILRDSDLSLTGTRLLRGGTFVGKIQRMQQDDRTYKYGGYVMVDCKPVMLDGYFATKAEAVQAALAQL